MESRVHDVIHGSFVGGKTNNSNTLKKRGPSGRKPLGDLSNSVKHTINQTSKKLNCDILPIQEEPSSSKVTGPREKKVAPASKKKASVGGRKALCDISNSAKPHLPEALRKVLKAPTRFGSLSEEPALHSIDSEKQFLHDHQECIKAQTHSMDLDEFLKVVGLHDVVDQPASPRLSELKVGKLNAETPSGISYLEEMTESLLIEEPSASRAPRSLAHCKTPMISGLLFSRTKYDSVDFCLMETPLSKKLESSD